MHVVGVCECGVCACVRHEHTRRFCLAARVIF